MNSSLPSTAQYVELVLNIVAKKLAIDVEVAREKAINGTLSAAAKAYYSRQQRDSETLKE
ncbi:TPA: hypothetical protein ACPZQZ_001982 [Yersinia enterocolitica]|uniref:hypothetical protein n=1 Tax=Yersinia enterocolitica TaxID=630 RepID=UPI00031B7E13|nr:hypothetical protein [Yersinia enterocolitica]